MTRPLSRRGGWTYTVDLLDDARALGVFDHPKFDKLVERLEGLKHVDYVEDRHQFWVRINPEHGNPIIATQRVMAAIDKIDRLLSQYQRKSA